MRIAPSPTVPLTRTRNQQGRAIPGLWQNEHVRMEKYDELWRFQVPMREIGRTGYYEFCGLEQGGHWHTIGNRRNRKGCSLSAERLLSGELVLQPAHSTGDGPVPARLLPWTQVSEAIARHPSVTGDSTP